MRLMQKKIQPRYLFADQTYLFHHCILQSSMIVGPERHLCQFQDPHDPSLSRNRKCTKSTFPLDFLQICWDLYYFPAGGIEIN